LKILLALDGSPLSLVARDLVLGLPWPEQTTIHLLTAYQVPIDWTGGVGSSMDWVGDIEDAIRDRALDQLRTDGSPLVSRGLGVVEEARRGRAANAINEVAAEIEADLVILGSRGRGQVASMLLGSVATEVATNAPSPVLVARGTSVSRLLVATDGSGQANAIPARLAEWNVFRGASADVLAVSVPDGAAFELMVSLYTLGDERLGSMRSESARKAGADGEAMAERLAEVGIRAEAHVRAGDAAREIVAAAEDHDADVIVLGSRGLGGVERLLLGSTARNVLIHSRRSVLIMRGSDAGA
jgi:nucleotide-binding universal stress UspA family protein